MLIKKKILEAELPELLGESCVARLFQIKASEKIFIMDVLSKRGEKFRCASDGVNFITYNYQDECWTESKIYILTGWTLSISSIDDGTDYAARRFFKKKEGSAYRIFEEWQCDKIEEKRDAARISKRNLQERRLALFPKIDEKIIKWCDKKVFINYIFLSNVSKGQRTAKCNSCKKEWVIGKDERKHKKESKCPHCRRLSKYFLERYKSSILDKGKINIYYRADGYILSRWAKVIRYFNLDGSQAFEFADYWYTGLPLSNDREFYYGEVIASYWANYIGRKYWPTPSRDENAVVYKRGLNKVLAEYINGFDIESVADCVDVMMVIRKFRKYPQTEYLLKLGLYKLAENADWIKPEGSGFEGVLDISKQYLPMYQKLNPSYFTHTSIAGLAKREFISEELARIIEKRNITVGGVTEIQRISGGGSVGKVIRYIDKQDMSEGDFLHEYRDYFSMAHQLGITLRHKYDIWPKNLREEHDKLSEKVNILKDQLAEKEFIEKTAELYKTIPNEFKNKKYLIKLPEHAGDFGAEGQNLKICVGSYGYRDEHIKGNSLICFIRKAESPDESFVCCEISLKNYKVRQVHGYKNDIDKPLPKEVKTFAAEYAEKIKKFREEIA